MIMSTVTTTAPVQHHAYILGKDSTGAWIVECHQCVPPIRKARSPRAAAQVRRDHETVTRAHLRAHHWTMDHGTVGV
jgi:hypothetical protein